MKRSSFIAFLFFGILLALNLQLMIALVLIGYIYHKLYCFIDCFRQKRMEYKAVVTKGERVCRAEVVGDHCGFYISLKDIPSEIQKRGFPIAISVTGIKGLLTKELQKTRITAWSICTS